MGNSPTNGTDPSGNVSFWNDPLEWAYGSDAAVWNVGASTSYLGQAYHGMGEGIRDTLGDAYLAEASGWGLVGGATAASAAAVLVGWAAPLVVGVEALSWSGVAIAGAAGGAAEYSALIGAANLEARYRGSNVAPSFRGDLLAANVIGGAVGGVACKGVGQFLVWCLANSVTFFGLRGFIFLGG